MPSPGPESPNPSPSERAYQEVEANSNPDIRVLEIKTDESLKDIAEQVADAFDVLKCSFQPSMISRRMYPEGAAIVVAPEVIDNDSSNPDWADSHLLPRWQELHPEILKLFGARNNASTESNARNQVQVIAFRPLDENRVELILSPIAIKFCAFSNPAEAARQGTEAVFADHIEIEWSPRGFIEAAKHLVDEFDTYTTRDQRAEPLHPNIAAARYRNRQGVTPHTNKPKEASVVPINNFLEHCPCYLAGLVAREVMHRYHDDATIGALPQVAEVKFRNTWDVEVNVIIAGERRSLIITQPQSGQISFEWADKNLGVVDLGDAKLTFNPPAREKVDTDDDGLTHA